MDTLEALASAWASHAMRMTGVFTAAVLLVLLLRRVLRRACGAEALPLLWWLVPLALVAMQLPHPTLHVGTLPPVVVSLVGAGNWAPAAPAPGWHLDGPLLAMTLWMIGAIAVLVRVGVVQRRYLRRLASARAIDLPGARYPVWQATRSDIGPAVVGALAVRIVLPADFEVRYTAREQALILAHEHAHARRRDGLGRLLAQAVVALFWCHPLAWVALARLRQDQELACDAAVLREHGAPRRDYAHAMLKTPASPLRLPVGCSWSARHPLTERVAMLKLPVPTRVRRLAGRATLGAIVLAGSVAVYAAQSTPPVHSPSAAAVKEALVLFDGAKTAVGDYWLHHAYELPADNAAAHLPDAALIAGRDVAGVQFARGRLSATLKDAAGGGHVVLVAMPDAQHRTMRWRCESPDIPAIGQLHEGCAHVPAGASDDGAGGTTFTLELAVSVAGQPAHLHATTCLKGTNDAYRFVDKTDRTLAPWQGQVGVVNGPAGQVEVHARLSGGSLDGPATPIVRMKVGQRAAIQLGQVVAGADHTLRLDLAAWPGCGPAPVAVIDGAVHERFRGPSARVMATRIAAQAGLRLDDPQALDDERPIAGNFDGVPAREALRLIGQVVGRTAVFEGDRVRYVAP